MVWRAGTVRRRLGIPRGEPLLAWAAADHRGMRVPDPLTGPVRPWPPYVVLTDRSLWVGHRGATHRFALEDVVMASIVDEPDGALRVDFLAGDPLVVLVLDGGVLHDRLVREIRAIDRRLQLAAPRALGLPDLSLGAVAGDGVLPGAGSRGEPPEAAELLHEAQLIALRELRTALSTSRVR
jgi:hypothetical protein